ncbi:protein PAL OF QUIRKY isoform X1 [Musa acuminata AAA Group]|uniref:protein PAL OF QUIRKY isoform X1 n=1 Tax=Musa acuminata AAA Group TaxID=214697 RepID=UPI0008A0BAD1|nr:PREDICTED: uncharacterized protein LOC103994740 isoform X1 [Musa acuminata subsp. malaccensis]
MAGTSSSASYSSFGDVSVKSTGPCIKFLCSYGGKILPRYPDGKLRYVGGYTRVVAIGRSISFSELQVKLRELCGWGGTVSLRCQLPTEDLDTLVSVTSDDDLADLVEEYDVASRDRPSPLKIRAFLLLLLLQNQSHHPSEPTASAMSSCTRAGIFASTAMAAHEHQTVSCVTSAACCRCHLGKKEEHIKQQDVGIRYSCSGA